MNYENTFRNWRWWLVLPLAVAVLPFALIDLFSVYAVRPVWTRVCDWVHEKDYV